MADHPSHVKFINSPDVAAVPGFTHAVEVTGGRTLYLSGQIALDQAGNIIGAGDFRAQARQVFENLKNALAAAGADFTHVVKLNLYLTDMAHLPILREVRDQYVNTQHPPASTAVEVGRLAREGLIVEVEAVASISE